MNRDCPLNSKGLNFFSKISIIDIPISLFYYFTFFSTNFGLYTVAMIAVASLGAPDSPVAHRTVRWIIAECAWRNPKVKSWRSIHPGAPDTVRCARPGFSSVSFAPFFWTLTRIFLLVCVEPLTPGELIFKSKLVITIICVGQFNPQNHLGKGLTLFPFQSPPFWWLMPTQTKANI
jgi:hypothetical protein